MWTFEVLTLGNYALSGVVLSQMKSFLNIEIQNQTSLTFEKNHPQQRPSSCYFLSFLFLYLFVFMSSSLSFEAMIYVYFYVYVWLVSNTYYESLCVDFCNNWSFYHNSIFILIITKVQK